MYTAINCRIQYRISLQQTRFPNACVTNQYNFELVVTKSSNFNFSKSTLILKIKSKISLTVYNYNSLLTSSVRDGSGAEGGGESWKFSNGNFFFCLGAKPYSFLSLSRFSSVLHTGQLKQYIKFQITQINTWFNILCLRTNCIRCHMMVSNT